MTEFHYGMPTELYYGEHCVKNNPQVFQSLGKRAMIITYEFPAGARHYALEDVKELLARIGTEYYVSFGVKEDPPISSIEAVRDEAVRFGADYIIAIGGGSAIDTAKAVCLLAHSDRDAVSVLFSTDPLENVLPLVAIPTTCGTGSEVTCWIAVTREDIKSKGGTARRIFPNYAFEDVRYIMELPPKVTRSTALDALCHAAESYLNCTTNLINRAYGELAMKLFAKFKDTLLTSQYTREDRENMLLAATIAGVAMTEKGSSLPHGCSYPISLNKHMSHGLACAVTLVPYFKIFRDRTEVNKVVAWCGFESLDEMEAYMREVMAADLAAYSVTDEELQAWSDEVGAQKARFDVHPEPAGRDDVYQMYRDAFRK